MLTIAIIVSTLFPILNVGADTKSVSNTGEVTVTNAEKRGVNLLGIGKDEYGRTKRAVFVGNDKNQLGHRSQPSPPKPANLKRWTNQRLSEGGYLWDRGHLIGDQFAGYTSNDPYNLVGQTTYLNKKLMTYFEGGMRTSNKNALDNWLYLHPNYYIEYRVSPNWGSPTENYPRSVTLQYRGISKDGTPIQIQLPELNAEGAGKQVVDNELFTTVTLQNIQPGYVIDYRTGRAMKKNSTQQDLYPRQDLDNTPLQKMDKTQSNSQETANLIQVVLKLLERGLQQFANLFSSGQ